MDEKPPLQPVTGESPATEVTTPGRVRPRSTRVLNVFRRLRSRIADAYWERKIGPVEPVTGDRATRLLARLDQALAANRDKRRMVVCDDPENCQPYGEHYRRLHGGTE